MWILNISLLCLLLRQITTNYKYGICTILLLLLLLLFSSHRNTFHHCSSSPICWRATAKSAVFGHVVQCGWCGPSIDPAWHFIIVQCKLVKRDTAPYTYTCTAMSLVDLCSAVFTWWKQISSDFKRIMQDQFRGFQQCKQNDFCCSVTLDQNPLRK